MLRDLFDGIIDGLLIGVCLLICVSIASADTYSDAYAKAVSENKPLVVFVGPLQYYGPVSGTVVCKVDSLGGYKVGDIVVSEPCDGKLYWVETVQDVSLIHLDGHEALDELNTMRIQRGLRPYTRDDSLTAAAKRCAKFRADNLMFGHTSNDFAFLNGAQAEAAGCAAYEPSYGWLSCCMWDNNTYAGAAYAMGRDGKRYMHIYVR